MHTLGVHSSWHLLSLTLTVSLTLPARSQGPPASPVFKPSARSIMTWVPPYQTARSEARIRGANPSPGPADVLTHVGLQFWVPTAEGPVHRVTHYDRLTDELIAGWRDWCHAQG